MENAKKSFFLILERILVILFVSLSSLSLMGCAGRWQGKTSKGGNVEFATSGIVIKYFAIEFSSARSISVHKDGLPYLFGMFGSGGEGPGLGYNGFIFGPWAYGAAIKVSSLSPFQPGYGLHPNEEVTWSATFVSNAPSLFPEFFDLFDSGEGEGEEASGEGEEQSAEGEAGEGEEEPAAQE